MSDYKSPFLNPRISSFFGPRIHRGKPQFHPGMDVISSNSTGPLNAMGSGTVVGRFAYRDGNSGLLVLNDDGLLIAQFGLNAEKTQNVGIGIGDHVEAGTQIGIQGNSDSKKYHTHFEVITPTGVEKLGFKQVGVNDDGTPIWTLNGRPISPSNEVTHAMWVDKIRPGNVLNKNLLLPPELVFPAWTADRSSPRPRPNYEGWPAQTWDAISGYQFARGTNPKLPQLRLPFGLSPYHPADIGNLGIPPDLMGPNGYGTGQRGMGPNVDSTFGPASTFSLPGSGGPPRSAGLPDWLGPNLGTISSYSFPNSLQAGTAPPGIQTGNRFLPLPHSRDLPVFNVGGYTNTDPWNASTYASPLPDPRLIASDPASYAGSYPWSGEPPSLSILKGGVDPRSYGPAPSRSLTPDMRPGTDGGNFDRGTSPQSPLRMNGVPDPGSSGFSNPPTGTPQSAYWPPRGGWSGAPTTSDARLTSQTFSPADTSPNVPPTDNALTSAAPDLTTWPLAGSGILSGWRPASTGGILGGWRPASTGGILGGLTPVDAWTLPGNGALGGLPAAAAGGSGRPEGDGDLSWAQMQMLQELWLRRLQQDSS